MCNFFWSKSSKGLTLHIYVLQASLLIFNHGGCQ